jgi:hypothetical protein
MGGFLKTHPNSSVMQKIVLHRAEPFEVQIKALSKRRSIIMDGFCTSVIVLVHWTLICTLQLIFNKTQ